MSEPNERERELANGMVGFLDRHGVADLLASYRAELLTDVKLVLGVAELYLRKTSRWSGHMQHNFRVCLRKLGVDPGPLPAVDTTQGDRWPSFDSACAEAAHGSKSTPADVEKAIADERKACVEYMLDRPRNLHIELIADKISRGEHRK